jgi:hypothetical protein
MPGKRPSSSSASSAPKRAWKGMWEPSTMLANQCWHQRQCPLGQVSLATTYEDADLRCANQSEQLLPQDSSSGAHTATVSLQAATRSADFTTGHLDPLGSPPTALTALWSAHSQPAADTRKTNEPACCGWSFMGIHWAHPALELRPFSGPTTPHQLPHTLLACSSVYSSSNSNKYLL